MTDESISAYLEAYGKRLDDELRAVLLDSMPFIAQTSAAIAMLHSQHPGDPEAVTVRQVRLIVSLSHVVATQAVNSLITGLLADMEQKGWT